MFWGTTFTARALDAHNSEPRAAIQSACWLAVCPGEGGLEAALLLDTWQYSVYGEALVSTRACDGLRQAHIWHELVDVVAAVDLTYVFSFNSSRFSAFPGCSRIPLPHPDTKISAAALDLLTYDVKIAAREVWPPHSRYPEQTECKAFNVTLTVTGHSRECKQTNRL